MNKPALAIKSVLNRTKKIFAKLKWVFLIVFILFCYNAARRHIRTIRYFKSGKRYVQQSRDENIREAERLMNITLKLNGLEETVDLSEYINHKKKPSYSYREWWGYVAEFEQPQVTVSVGAISHVIEISNNYFKQKIKSGEIDILAFSKNDSETKEYAWKQGEKLLHSYFPESEYPNYKFKRGIMDMGCYDRINGRRIECSILTWTVYCKDNLVIPGGVRLSYYYDRGFSDIRFSLCDCHQQRVKVSEKQALQIAWKRASLFADLIPGVKAHLYSIRLVQMTPRRLHCLIQPVFADMKQNENHRLMYDIRIPLVDRKFDPKNKSLKYALDHTKGGFAIYVDAYTGERYTNEMYMNETYYCKSQNFLNFSNLSVIVGFDYDEWFRKLHPQYFNF